MARAAGGRVAQGVAGLQTPAVGIALTPNLSRSGKFNWRLTQSQHALSTAPRALSPLTAPPLINPPFLSLSPLSDLIRLQAFSSIYTEAPAAFQRGASLAVASEVRAAVAERVRARVAEIREGGGTVAGAEEGPEQ